MNKKSKVLFALGILMLLFAVGLTVFNLVDNIRATVTAESILEKMNISSKSENDPVVPERQMPEKEVDGRKYIGEISIKAIDVRLPVQSGCNEEALTVSPCRYTGSVYTNDMIIAAHNYTDHFGKFRRLSVGDKVIFTDIDGNTYKFSISEVEMIDPYDIQTMVSGDWDLTLFTCTLGGGSRITVRCIKE